jgi:Lipocalin-like domain
MRRVLLGVAGLAVTAVVGLPLANAGTDGPSARAKVERKLVGSWRLLSFVVRDAGGRGYPFGKDAVGRLTYTRDGTIWALVARRNAPKNLPDALWYTGTFHVDLKRRTIVHHVRHASISVWEGGDQLRPFKLSGDRLTLTTPPATTGAATGVLRWERERGRSVHRR